MGRSVGNDSGRSFLRPIATLGRKSRRPRELAGRVIAIGEWLGWEEAIGVDEGQVTGSSASGPSSASVWKQRRASLRAIVIDALVH